jgi:predicted flap endonuclease-1-like 5' DNA nuclease
MVARWHKSADVPRANHSFKKQNYVKKENIMHWLCYLWWALLGGLIGWLLNRLFAKRPVQTVERVVTRDVEKIVEKPVDRIVEKLVDNPAHLSRIQLLENEAGTVQALRAQVSRLEATPAKVVEKIVEKIVDRPVEVIKTVEKIIDRPVEVIKTVEKIVDRPVEKIVEKIVDRPVEVIKTVEKIVDRPVDRVVEKLVDNPAHLTRIRTLETEVALIAGLRATISKLEATPPKIVEKIVDRPVDRIVEKIVEKPVEVIKTVEKIVDRPVEKIVEKIIEKPVEVIKTVEKIVDRPVEKIVEKIIEKPIEIVKTVEKIVEKPIDRVIEKLVDNPAHLTRIRALEGEVGLIAGLRSTISRLEATPPKIVEKIVDRPVEKIVEKIVDRPVEVIKTVEKIVDRPVDRIVEKVVEKIVDRPVEVIKTVEKIVDRPVDRIVEKQVDNPAHLARVKALEAELAAMKVRSVELDRAAAKAAGFTVRGMDDLIIIEGIGPKIAELFHNAGIHTFYDLSQSTLAQRQAILDAAGPNYRIANPGTWAEQAALAAKNRWAELKRLQDEELTVGVRLVEQKFDAAAAKAAGYKVKGMDDLEIIEGIGPKIADLFRKAGIKTFFALSRTSKDKMQEVLDGGGSAFKLADPSTWAQQARLASQNEWDKLMKLQADLTGGVRK